MPADALYLDANASCPMGPEVLEVLCRAQRELSGNPHSPHAAGRAAASALERAREQVGALLGRSAGEVRFTSGATEANAWALRGLAEAGRREGRGGRVLCTPVEHPSVLVHAEPALAVDAQGRLVLESLEGALRAGGVAAVSLMAAHHESGVLQPIAEAAGLCREAGVPLHADLSQLPGRLDARGLPADLLTVSAHKLGGPKGVGALVGPRMPPPLFPGGPQERGERAGTVAVPLAVAFGAAAARCAPMDPGPRDRLDEALRELGAEIIGGAAARLPNTTLALFDVPGDLLVIALDLEGVQASTGAACASGAEEESRLLRALGRRGRPLRLSWQEGTPVLRVLPILRRVLARARALR